MDYASKRVTLKIEDGEEIIMVSECRDYLSNVIFAIVAEKLVWKRCETYLAYVHDTNVVGSVVKGIRTVKDFLNVFPRNRQGYHWIKKFNLDLRFF